jgi:Sigma-70, region 4
MPTCVDPSATLRPARGAGGHVDPSGSAHLLTWQRPPGSTSSCATRCSPCFAGLPRGQREVLVLRYYEQLTEAETAGVLGIAVGTVKSQASKAAASMRALLAAEPLTGRDTE